MQPTVILLVVDDHKITCDAYFNEPIHVHHSRNPHAPSQNKFNIEPNHTIRKKSFKIPFVSSH
jgi:hypothetical protein